MRFAESKTVERIGYDFYCDIANNIVEARKRKGWTQQELAKATGFSLGKIARMEAVQIRIKLNDVQKLSEALDVTINWLIDAEIDSQVGKCRYLVWPESYPDFRIYQDSTSKRMAFLEHEARINKCMRQYMGPRERAVVQLVGIPLTESEIDDRFPKLTTNEEEIFPE